MLQAIGDQLPVVRGDEVQKLDSRDLVSRDAEGPPGGGVGRPHVARHVHRQHQVHGVFEQVVMAQLQGALPFQLLLQLLRLPVHAPS